MWETGIIIVLEMKRRNDVKINIKIQIKCSAPFLVIDIHNLDNACLGLTEIIFKVNVCVINITFEREAIANSRTSLIGWSGIV